MGEKEEMKEMFQELTGFEKKNISLRINGVPASPMQIVQAHTMCEHQSYMRDYVLNDKGDVKEVWFQNITIYWMKLCIYPADQNESFDENVEI